MLNINYISVPSLPSEDLNYDKSQWRGGNIVSLDLGNSALLYIGHRPGLCEEGECTEAFCFRVPKPITRDAAVNAAEMEAYSLSSPMAVASLAASMARKHRLDPDDAEVKAHDEFIEWVKSGLTKIGVK